jgi:hypothetical protein
MRSSAAGQAGGVGIGARCALRGRCWEHGTDCNGPSFEGRSALCRRGAGPGPARRCGEATMADDFFFNIANFFSYFTNNTIF